MEVIPYIESFHSIRSWSIDTKAPDFLLQVETDDHVKPEEIVQLVKKAGYTIVLVEKRVNDHLTA